MATSGSESDTRRKTAGALHCRKCVTIECSFEAKSCAMLRGKQKHVKHESGREKWAQGAPRLTKSEKLGCKRKRSQCALPLFCPSRPSDVSSSLFLRCTEV
eukprot:3963862-Pleurochrysis_carterae.AAC.1